MQQIVTVSYEREQEGERLFVVGVVGGCVELAEKLPPRHR